MEQGKDLVGEERRKVVREELLIARMPEIFNKQAYKKGGVATFVRRNQKVEVGLPGMKVGFSHHELLVLVEIFQMWHELGRPESGEIYQENKSLSLSEFTDNLYGDERKFRTGKLYRQRVERWIKNLLTIPILQHNLKREENGDVRLELGSFTFLSGAEGILKKDGPYFDLTKVKIHPAIVKSMLAHNMKPLRLDVLRSLSGDNEVAFYRELDLVLSHRHEFSKPLIMFCNDLGINYAHRPAYVSKGKKICKRMVGKLLSCGSAITFCFVEMRAGDPWIFAKKGNPVAIELKNEKPLTPAVAVAPPAVVDAEKQEDERRDRLQKAYDQFNRAEKGRVEELKSASISKLPVWMRQSENTQESYFFEAVESVLKQEIVKGTIFSRSSDLVARETRRNAYMSLHERVYRNITAPFTRQFLGSVSDN